MDIDATNLGSAIDLLVRGFPGRTRRFWEDGISRLLTAPAHEDGGEPIGSLVTAGGRAVGVALSAISYRQAQEEKPSQRLVNLCSWYIEPDHRWRMPVLLRNAMRCKSSVYTDLSPSPGVRPMLETLGFEPLNNGVDVVCVPSMALSHRGSLAVTPWHLTSSDDETSGLARLIADHVALGCYAFAIEAQSGPVPVIVKPFPRYGIPLAQVIYCSDAQALQRALGGVSRALLARGRVGLVIDIPVNRAARSSFTRLAVPSRRRRYIKNGSQNGAIDYAYSELVFFDI